MLKSYFQQGKCLFPKKQIHQVQKLLLRTPAKVFHDYVQPTEHSTPNFLQKYFSLAIAFDGILSFLSFETKKLILDSSTPQSAQIQVFSSCDDNAFSSIGYFNALIIQRGQSCMMHKNYGEMFSEDEIPS